MTFVPSTDLARSRAFYADVLGLASAGEDPWAVSFRMPGVMLRVAKVPEAPKQPFTILGWIVPDITAKITELTAKGIVMERYSFLPQDDLGVWRSPEAKVAWFKDPDENVLSLTEWL
jgi:catechol 2,3-dioxygenase-like lactoylglutathione lyase family enzyme